MDILKHMQNIVNNKIELKEKQEEPIKYFVVYFLHNEDIVYIGKTSNILEYVEERKDKYSATHYYSEEIDINEVDNYLAKLVLEIQPIYNARVPNNTKYISNHAAKKDYFITKTEIRKVYQEYGGYEFKSSIFIEKELFNDIFAQMPYHEDMPKVGRRILLVDDYKYAQLNQWGGVIRDTLYDENGNPVEAYRDYKPDYKKEYKNIKYLKDKEYEVIDLIDSDEFEVLNFDNGKRLVLKASAKTSAWKDFDTNEEFKGLWINAIDECTISGIKHNYLKTLEEENDIR